METAKAVVDVPSPFSGKVIKLAGQVGDIVLTGASLVEIELDPTLPQRADAQDTGHHHAPPSVAAPTPPAPLSSSVTPTPPAPRPVGEGSLLNSRFGGCAPNTALQGAVTNGWVCHGQRQRLW